MAAASASPMAPRNTGGPSIVLPRVHEGECIVYGETDREWAACRFALAPAGFAAHPSALQKAFATFGPHQSAGFNDVMWLDRAGDLHLFPSDERTPALSVMVCPWTPRDGSTPIPFLVPVLSLDAIGLRATLPGRKRATIDILNPEHWRDLAAQAETAPELAGDVAGWTRDLSTRNPEQLPPRLRTSLGIERIARVAGDTVLPAGVTLQGYARWRLVQGLRYRWDLGRDVSRFVSTSAVEDLALACGMPEARPTNVETARDEMLAPLSRLTQAFAHKIFRIGLGVGRTLAEIEAEAQRLGWTAIETDWAADHMAAVRSCIDLWRPDSRLDSQMRLLTRTARTEHGPPGMATDMLISVDAEGARAHAWPTHTRRERGTLPSDVPMVCAADIPSVEEVVELEARVHADRDRWHAHERSERAPAQPPPQPAI